MIAINVWDKRSWIFEATHKTEGRSELQVSGVLIAVSRVFSQKKPSQNAMSRRDGEE
jgi:hypothetical protein